MDKDGLSALIPDLTAVHLRAGATLWRDESNIRKIYFPVDAVVSVLAGAEDTRELELMTIGNEGVVGLSALMDVPRSVGHALVQISGDAFVASAGKVRELMGRDKRLANLMARYGYLAIRMIVQNAVCHRFHKVDERCARWLLTTHDRAGTDEFSLSQEFLGRMMGAARSKVNVALAHLRTRGAIDQRYRRILVVDRHELEAAACSCYEVLRRIGKDVEI
jgi:CRP-like cAMP-binding protein